MQATDRKYMFVGILASEKPENVLVVLIPYPCQGRGKIVSSSLSDPLSQAKKHVLILRWSLVADHGRRVCLFALDINYLGNTSCN